MPRKRTPKRESRTEIMTFRFTKRQKDLLEAIEQKLGISPTELVRMALGPVLDVLEPILDGMDRPERKEEDGK